MISVLIMRWNLTFEMLGSLPTDGADQFKMALSFKMAKETSGIIE